MSSDLRGLLLVMAPERRALLLCVVLGCTHGNSTLPRIWAEEATLREPRWMDWRPVLGVEGAVELSGGEEYTCARLGSGEVVCWGCQATICNDATLIDLPPDALEVASGPDYSCIRRVAGVECWGPGQPVRGLVGEERTPRPLEGVGVVDEMALGRTLACFRRNGTIWCTSGSAANRVLVRVPRLHDAVQVVAGTDFFCALRAAGSVECWGAGGQVAEQPVPRQHADRTDSTGSMPLVCSWRLAYLLR